MDEILPFATVIGPIILLAVIVWAWMRSRNTSRADRERGEAGARELRRDIANDPEKDVDL